MVSLRSEHAGSSYKIYVNNIPNLQKLSDHLNNNTHIYSILLFCEQEFMLGENVMVETSCKQNNNFAAI